MQPWQLDLLVASTGLAAASLVLRPMLRRWRAEPVASYRLLCWVLVATLLFPLGQGLLRGSGLGSRVPFAGKIAEEFAFLRKGESGDANPSGAPVDAAGFGGSVPEERAAAATHLVVLSAAWRVGEEGQEIPRAGLPAAPSDQAPAMARVRLEAPEQAWKSEDIAAAAPEEILETPIASSVVLRSDRARWFSLGLVGTYLVGLLFSLGRTGLRLRRTSALLRRARPVENEAVLGVWRELAKRSSLAPRVRLLASPEVPVPMCYGLRRPVVLLPAAAGPELSREVLSCVLLHELVHLERRDTWIMLAQELLRALFWFHPAASWLSKRIDQLRELSCDLTVVRRTGRLKRYASALVEYAAWMGRDVPQVVPATSLVPWTTTNSQLARRIEMLVSQSHPRDVRRGPVFLAASAMAALFGGQVALAASMAPAQGPLQREVERSSQRVVEVSEEATEVQQDSEKAERTVVILYTPEEGGEPIELEGEIIVLTEDGEETTHFHGGANGDERVLERHIIVEDGEGEVVQESEESNHWLVHSTDDDGHQISLFLEEIEAAEEPEAHGHVETQGPDGESRVFEFGSIEELEELAESGALPGLHVMAPQERARVHRAPRRPPFPGSDRGGDEPPMIGISIETFGPGATELEITRVFPGSIAERAGLREGDVIVEIEDGPATWEALNEAKQGLRDGGIEVEIERDGEEFEVELRAEGGMGQDPAPRDPMHGFEFEDGDRGGRMDALRLRRETEDDVEEIERWLQRTREARGDDRWHVFEHGFAPDGFDPEEIEEFVERLRGPEGRMEFHRFGVGPDGVFEEHPGPDRDGAWRYEFRVPGEDSGPDVFFWRRDDDSRLHRRERRNDRDGDRSVLRERGRRREDHRGRDEWDDRGRGDHGPSLQERLRMVEEHRRELEEQRRALDEQFRQLDEMRRELDRMRRDLERNLDLRDAPHPPRAPHGERQGQPTPPPAPESGQDVAEIPSFPAPPAVR